MELKPGYKKTEIGIIPEDWSIDEYISFGQIIDGDRGFNYPGATELKDSGYCLFLNAGNVAKNGFKFSDCQFISAEKDKKLNKGKLARGDVVLTTRGTIGNFSYFSDQIPFDNMRINSGMVILRNISPLLLNTYQYLVLNSQLVSRQIERLSFGSAQPQLTVKGISTIKIPLPSTVTEQTAIAECLSDTDALIESLEQLIAKKRQIKQGAMQELLTGKKRLSEFANIKKYKSTKFGLIPNDWNVVTVGEVSEVGRGRVINQKMMIASLHQLYPVYSSQTTDNGIMGYIDSFDFNGEYITWTTDGANAGRIFYRNGKFNCTNVCGTIKLKLGNASFVATILSTISQKHVSRNLGNPKLMNDVMKKIEFPFPINLKEQMEIANILYDIDSEIIALVAKLEKARKVKQGMMYELLTGRIRLV